MRSAAGLGSGAAERLTGRAAPDYDAAMRWWQRHAVLLVLVAALFLAPVAGAAMVPDPTWIGGMYDGGDGDEVAILVWDLTSGIVPTVVVPPAPAGAQKKPGGPHGSSGSWLVVSRPLSGRR